MPANLLIFDADYISELTANMNTACSLFAEAVMSLHSATNHENWKCKERAVIADEFEQLNLKLGRLDSGVNETTRILGGSVSRFASLESQYEAQANALSDDLTSNHGFTASVRTENSAGTASATGAASAGALGSAAVHAAGGQDGKVQPGGDAGAVSHGTGTRGGFRVNVSGNMFNRRTNADNYTQTGSSSGSHEHGEAGGNSMMMNVNLPVTHIPDNPSAAAKGTKYTQAIADAALTSVAGAITKALAGGSPDSFTAARLNEAYNAGRSIFDSSSAILAKPSQPHTSERLAIAAGLVTLAQDTGNFQGVTVSSSSSAAQNAGVISSALQGNSEASELRGILDSISRSTTENSSASDSNNLSFFDMIIEEIKKAFLGGNENAASSSGNTLAESSPVMDFLGNFVMDQAV